MADDSWVNKLYYGDNLDMMRKYISDESVDLIYLDPPFNSKATYNVLYQESNGTASAAQIEAFEDTWHWEGAVATYQEIVENSTKKLTDLMHALYQFLGHNDMMAYLTMMAIRLQELHRVLKPTGSVYLHCDPTASHYLKLVMDAIFSAKYFRNEIVWSYKRYTAKGNRYQREHDILFYYSKSDKSVFNEPREEYGPKSGKADSHYKQDEDGRWYRWQKRKGQEPYKIYLSEGRRIGDVWPIPHINASAKERLGYPTQKPEALLERIIQASSNEGGVVFDPFCGCGTTISVAEHLHRRWIGIDITHLAITLIKRRLEDHFPNDLQPYEVIGNPKDLPGAQTLADQDKFQFEWWALDLVGARPARDRKKGADKGIDGYIVFFEDERDPGSVRQVVVQVKGGSVNRSHVATLKGDMEREKAAIGVLVTLQPATRPMREEAAAAGFYDSPHYGRFPKLQILTIEELLGGQVLKMPPRRQVDKTFKKAEKKTKKREDQTGLF
ncbi:MAG: restriction endonuclease [Actinobacteria bacterium]|nr:restriction endonuclease [Actinomycetota bacterium]